mmetsp:Transcript_28408/g.90903  ORF Transcript_28408/g.90903 Transcript_28408/m.90903 type:complete len:250 (+) Transcript_28408:422-1171(+)
MPALSRRGTRTWPSRCRTWPRPRRTSRAAASRSPASAAWGGRRCAPCSAATRAARSTSSSATSRRWCRWRREPSRAPRSAAAASITWARACGTWRRASHGARADPNLGYARVLGLTRLVRRYDVNPDVLKNFTPWISRSEADVDVNFIPNCNTNAAEGNVLTRGGALRPGIVYACLDVADVEATKAAYTAAGVDFVDAAALAGAAGGGWELPPSKVKDLGRPSIFVKDPDGSYFRLAQEAVVAPSKKHG